MNIPLYSHFENALKTQKKHIQDAWREGRWVSLGLYLLLIIVASVILFFGVVATIRAAFPGRMQTAPIDIYKPPTLALSYETQNFSVDENGLFHTNFIIKIDQPPGNFQETFSITKNSPNIQNADCSKPEWKQTATFQNGSIFHTRTEYEIKCTSEKPIVDDKYLFAVQ